MQEIDRIQTDMTRLTNEREQLERIKTDLESQRDNVIQKKLTFESRFKSTADHMVFIEDQIKQLNEQRNDLFSRQRQLLELHQTLHEKLSEEETRLFGIRSEIKSLQSQIQNLELSKADYLATLKRQKPEEQYRIDNETCENGIYHCKNHPPRRVLANQNEIDLYYRTINDARDAQYRIQNQIDDLQTQLAAKEEAEDSITNNISNLREQIQQCTEGMQQVQAELYQCQNDLQQYQEDLKKYESEINQIDNELLAAKSTESTILASIDENESELRQIENNIQHLSIRLSMLQQNAFPSNNNDRGSFFRSENQFPSYSNEAQMLQQIAEAELQREKEQNDERARREQILLEKMARDELEREQALLEQMARMELAQEQQSNNMSDQIVAGVNDMVQGLKNAKETITNSVSQGVHAATSLYPYPGNLLVSAMFQRVDEEFFDRHNPNTGNPILDSGTAARHRGPN